MKIFVYIFFLLLIPCSAISQYTANVSGKEYYLVYSKVVDGDTLPHIFLREITILPPKTFKNEKQKQKYLRLVYNIKRVYPYAKLANKKLREIDKKMKSLPTEFERSRYIKVAEMQLKNEFEDELKDLTIRQGELLIKLVDRETGATTYDLVKQLRGNLQAFFWQSLARMFGSNLKTEYDAAGEDKIIEEIIIRIENGQL